MGAKSKDLVLAPEPKEKRYRERIMQSNEGLVGRKAFGHIPPLAFELSLVEESEQQLQTCQNTLGFLVCF